MSAKSTTARKTTTTPRKRTTPAQKSAAAKKATAAKRVAQPTITPEQKAQAAAETRDAAIVIAALKRADLAPDTDLDADARARALDAHVKHSGLAKGALAAYIIDGKDLKMQTKEAQITNAATAAAAPKPASKRTTSKKRDDVDDETRAICDAATTQLRKTGGEKWGAVRPVEIAWTRDAMTRVEITDKAMKQIVAFATGKKSLADVPDARDALRLISKDTKAQDAKSKLGGIRTACVVLAISRA